MQNGGSPAPCLFTQNQVPKNPLRSTPTDHCSCEAWLNGDVHHGHTNILRKVRRRQPKETRQIYRYKPERKQRVNKGEKGSLQEENKAGKPEGIRNAISTTTNKEERLV